MRAFEVLDEYGHRMRELEARREGLERLVGQLEVLGQTLRLRSTSGGAVDRIERLCASYDELRQLCLTDIDNLTAAHRDALCAIDRLESPKHREILTWVFVVGLSVYEAAERMGLPKRSAYNLHEAALALLDSKL